MKKIKFSFRKSIVHLIVALISINLMIKLIYNFDSSPWDFYILILLIVAFYAHTFLLLPILIYKKNIKKYALLTVSSFLIVNYAISWIMAIKSSVITVYENGNHPLPSDFFFQTQWLFRGLITGLSFFTPFVICSLLYQIFTMSQKRLKMLFSYRYIEGFFNGIIVASLLVLNFLNTQDFIENGLEGTLSFSLWFIVFYINVFVLAPHFLKTRNIIKYSFSLIILLGFMFLSRILIHGIIYIDIIKPFNSLVTEIIIFSIFILLSFIYTYVRLKLKANEKIFDLKLTAKDSELQLLKSQVNPHFLFNTLNTIYATALKENAPKTAESTAKLANLLRYMQSDINKDFIPLQNEINYLNDYIIIQKLRCAVEPEIKTTFKNIEDQLISPGLLIPFVENAFKYGIDPTKKSELTISVICKENNISFNCMNSYNENFKVNAIEEGFGIGIKNAKQRLELVYPNQHTFEIIKENDIFSVKLIIPIKEE